MSRITLLSSSCKPGLQEELRSVILDIDECERGYAYDVDLEPLSMTAYQLAKAIGAPARLRDRTRRARRERPQAGPLLRHRPGVLAQPALPPRPGGSQRSGRRESGR